MLQWHSETKLKGTYEQKHVSSMLAPPLSQTRQYWTLHTRRTLEIFVNQSWKYQKLYWRAQNCWNGNCMSRVIVTRKSFINTSWCSCSNLSGSYLLSPWDICFFFLQDLQFSVSCVNKRGIQKPHLVGRHSSCLKFKLKTSLALCSSLYDRKNNWNKSTYNLHSTHPLRIMPLHTLFLNFVPKIRIMVKRVKWNKPGFVWFILERVDNY